MANIKITELQALTDPASTDVLPIVDVDVDGTRKVSIADMLESAGDGTEALPGIAFDSDPNTGIYRAGSDEIAVSTAGTQRLHISSGGVVTISGNLTVEGTTTTFESTTVTIDDKNVELGSVDSPTDGTADGGGITLKGSTDKTISWVNSTDAWTFSEHIEIANGKEYYIDGNSVLSATTLGNNVVNSSLTGVGTISSGTWQGTAIATAYIADDAVTADKLADTAVTAGSYTAADITVDAQGRITAAASGTISTAEIADDAVTADKLANTAVTAGSYTAADITVDAQGRITAAANGTISTAEIANDAVTADKLADDAVNSDKIADGSIANVNVSATAAIAGTKISPDFGSQTVSTTGDLAINTDTLFADSSADRVGVNTSTPAVSLDINATDAVALPHGTEAQRPSDGGTPANLTGYIRFNTTTTQFEGHNGTSWASVGGGATGGGSDQWAIEHDNTVNDDYTITANRNVISAGPITIGASATVTVGASSNWSIV